MKTRISDKLFKQHVIDNALFPQQDSQQYMAYLTLLYKYPALTYWSMDGYSCDALADYSKNIVWERDNIIDWSTKEIICKTTKPFWECTTAEVVCEWMKANGETYRTKVDWLRGVV